MNPKLIVLNFYIFICLGSFTAIGQSENNANPKTIMLILGSGNLKTSVERAELGFDLYSSNKNFDYIILSGGCGAHNSGICEASVMADILIEKGVPEALIFKEEKSRNTAQNYCYSRELTDEDGRRLINKGDRLFVVSNHWHAISISGCFNDKDLVNSSYYVAGNLLPKPTQKTDYNGIYENCMRDSLFCKSVLWPRIDAAYSSKNSHNKYNIAPSVFYLDDVAINRNSSDSENNTVASPLRILPTLWSSDIQASYYNKYEDLVYIFKKQQVLAIHRPSSNVQKGYPKNLADLFTNLPDGWQVGNLDAAFFDSKNKKAYFFKADKVLIANYKKNRLLTVDGVQNIVTLVKNWPFDWSSGNIDAAHFVEKNNEVIFYRGQDQMTLNITEGQWQIIKGPEKVELEWPVEIWGERIVN